MNIKSRDVEMDQVVRFRATTSDKQQLKHAAKKVGLNTSSFIRLMLIQQGIIEA